MKGSKRFLAVSSSDFGFVEGKIIIIEKISFSNSDPLPNFDDIIYFPRAFNS